MKKQAKVKSKLSSNKVSRDSGILPKEAFDRKKKKKK